MAVKFIPRLYASGNSAVAYIPKAFYELIKKGYQFEFSIIESKKSSIAKQP